MDRQERLAVKGQLKDAVREVIRRLEALANEASQNVVEKLRVDFSLAFSWVA